MKDCFLKYGIVLGRRYTTVQKKIFINAFSEDLKESGIDVSLHKADFKMRKMTNIMIGNVDTAPVIYVAGYDTGSKVLLPKYKYYPFNTKRNLSGEAIHLLFSFFVSALPLIPCYFLIGNFSIAPLGLKIITVILTFAAFICMFVLTNGIANPVNYNRNSAAVVLIRALAEQLKNSQNAAFILMDSSVNAYEGFRLVHNYYGDKVSHHKFIILDCLAAGEILVAAHNQDMCHDVEKLIEIAPELSLYDKLYSSERSEQMALHFLPKSIYLVSGSIDKKEFTVYNSRTKNDYKLDLERLENIKQMFLTYTNNETKP